METLFLKVIFELLATSLIAIIAWFLKQMSASLKKIERDIHRINQDNLLFQQKTNFRLGFLEEEIKSIRKI